MRSTLPVTLMTAGLTAIAYLAAPAYADQWNKRTILKFDQPVEVPGHVLTPGKYAFQLADLQADRNVVEIFSENNQKGTDRLVTTTMAIPDYRVATPDHPRVTFEERHSNSPEAIHSIFYPGDNYGWQFIYPKGQTLETAANTPPPPPPAATPAPAPAPPQTQAEANEQPAPPSEQPNPEPVTTAQNNPPARQAAPQTPPAPQQATPPASQPSSKNLPQTASDLPLEEVLGTVLLALGAGGLLIGLRRARA